MSVPGGGKLTLTIKSFATLMVHNVTKVNIWEKKKINYIMSQSYIVGAL